MHIVTCDELVKKRHEPKKHPMVLKGLKAAHLGMLIAAPGIGKSRCALSIAMEVAGGTPLIGLSASNKPEQVLMISTEDVEDVVVERVDAALSEYPGDKALVRRNLSFCCDIEPLVVPPDASVDERVKNKNHLETLVTLFSQYKLVIVDTVSEAIGDCEEVKHDRHIKNTLSKLAKASGAAVLLVHHVTKDDIRGKNKLTMASGSGLSTLIRLSKFQIGLKRDKGFELVFLKHNYLTPAEALPIPLTESETGFITTSNQSLENHPAPSQSEPKVAFAEKSDVQPPEVMSKEPSPPAEKSRRRKDILSEPRRIEISTSTDAPQEETDVRNVL